VAGKSFRVSRPPYEVKVRFGPANLGEIAREVGGGLTTQRELILLVGGVVVNSNWLLPVVRNESHANLIEREKNWPKPGPVEITADEQRATELHIEQKGGPKLLLQTGTMAKPLRGLRDCVDDMIRSWGIDPQVQQNLSARPQPTGNPGTWVTSGDYPMKMLRERQNAHIRFRLIIGVDGKVISCAVQSAAGPTDFRDWTCDLIKRRAKFPPALDATGKPVKAYWSSSVRWGVPPDR
jgi:Gram-negative bacterial TonB protein C-terminal